MESFPKSQRTATIIVFWAAFSLLDVGPQAENGLPTFVYAAIFLELGLLLSATSTASHAGRLVRAARSYGANGI